LCSPGLEEQQPRSSAPSSGSSVCRVVYVVAVMGAVALEGCKGTARRRAKKQEPSSFVSFQSFRIERCLIQRRAEAFERRHTYSTLISQKEVHYRYLLSDRMSNDRYNGH